MEQNDISNHDKKNFPKKFKDLRLFEYWWCSGFIVTVATSTMLSEGDFLKDKLLQDYWLLKIEVLVFIISAVSFAYNRLSFFLIAISKENKDQNKIFEDHENEIKNELLQYKSYVDSSLNSYKNCVDTSLSSFKIANGKAKTEMEELVTKYSNKIQSSHVTLTTLFQQSHNDVKNDISKLQNRLKAHYKYSLTLLRLGLESGKFLKVGAVETLKMLSKNLDEYSEIHNIRIRPRNKGSEPLNNAITDWRIKLQEKLDESDDLIVKEIIVDHDDIDFDGGELSPEGLSKKYKNYQFKYLDREKSFGMQNFMLFKLKGVNDDNTKRHELYFGWHEGCTTSDYMHQFLTYSTTDPEVTYDYGIRFMAMYREIVN